MSEVVNEVVKIENGKLAAETIEYIKTIEAAKKQIEAKYEEFREQLKKAMENEKIIKLETDDILINYVAETTREAFDGKAFRDDFPDLYDEYIKFSPVKASVRFKLK